VGVVVVQDHMHDPPDRHGGLDPLGHVDGFDENEAECKGDDGAGVSRRLLAVVQRGPPGTTSRRR
jgi:hypothetical protein